MDKGRACFNIVLLVKLLAVQLLFPQSLYVIITQAYTTRVRAAKTRQYDSPKIFVIILYIVCTLDRAYARTPAFPSVERILLLYNSHDDVLENAMTDNWIGKWPREIVTKPA